MAKKSGRPALTPMYMKVIRDTPKGEVAIVGMLNANNEAFASYQAAQHHQRAITKSLGATGKGTATILAEPNAIEITDYDADRGRYVTSLHKGYYLVLKGRGTA